MEATNTAPVTAEAPSTEQTPSEAVNEPPKIDFSHKFAALARKEKAIFDQRKAIEAELSELNQWKEAKQQAKKNPNKFLEANGLDFETLARFNLEGGFEKEPSEIEAIKEKLERLEKETESQKRAREDQEKQQLEKNYEVQINDFKKQIEDHVVGAADKYEFIAANPDHLSDVFELIEIHFQKHQKIMNIDEACQLVEEHIENEFRNKYAKLNKLKGLLTPEEIAKVKQQPHVPRQQQDIRNMEPRPANLTNNMTPTASYGKSLDQMSFHERKRQAAAMLRFK